MILDWQMSTTQGVPGFSAWVWTSAPTAGATALGPFCFEAIQTFSGGAEVAETFAGGAESAETFSPGAEAVQTGCP